MLIQRFSNMVLPFGNEFVTLKRMEIKLEEYVQEDGTNPYQTWFNGLDAQAGMRGKKA